MISFRVIGLMSGTSLDGLDIVDVNFERNEQGCWSFNVNSSELVPFDPKMQKRLNSAFSLTAEEMSRLSADLGRFYGEAVNSFIDAFNIPRNTIDFVASHGQTIFHQPDKGYTLQIGNGPELSVVSNLPSVTDFRSKDVALGGNGAPLIPVADYLLFSDKAEAFLNLGGFSNLSYKNEDVVQSFDVCPVNIIVNDLMQQVGQTYDDQGGFGKNGIINQEVFKELNNLTYYTSTGPRSLGWEWVKENVVPIIQKEKEIVNRVRTIYEHIAFQIGRALNDIHGDSILITGGGAKNDFLIERLKNNTSKEIIVPDEQLIDFKEAIGFAFLGVLRWRKENNVWSSVTGSKRDSSSGVIIRP
ncbi:anhydro-N-acetylmuramic acid kinase [Brumimicrobium salinarum]|uniref:Anhydro-N-acetylmuramic acid kinase n=1 Tax=Brumimicrobium salinarum TaxID=2058658 RepID=A0A2I0QZZ7_9FLAO|nr:anhydro-N-acetylmuramic acid kinase [Brumimicrobium salinarum]PKR79898.1 anhydro-N-acetylmuramic acid kinase [Brumimicrobium salinarum]